MFSPRAGKIPHLHVGGGFISGRLRSLFPVGNTDATGYLVVRYPSVALTHSRRSLRGNIISFADRFLSDLIKIDLTPHLTTTVTVAQGNNKTGNVTR